MKKIIQINTHSFSNFLPFVSISNNQYKGGWHVKLSEQIKRYSSDYLIECWGMEKILNKTITFKKNDIVYKIFPSTYLKYLGEISFPLLKELDEEIRHNNIIIHFHGVFNYTTYLSSLLFKNVPMISQHHGDKSSLQNFYDNINNDKIKAVVYLILYLLKEKIFEMTAFKNIDHFFVLNEDAKTYISHIVGRYKVEKLTMGIEFDKYQKIDKMLARKKLYLEVDKKYILFSGAFVKGKGIDYLIKAFKIVIKRFPDSVLILKGEGYYKNHLKYMVNSIGIENNVLFLPWIEEDALSLFYNAADLFVLPSINEGLGMVAVEALACETPFIGTNVGGIPEVIKIFKNGIIVPPKNSEVLADNIISILDDNKSFNVDKDNAAKYYDWKNIVKKNIDAYDELWRRYYE